MRWSIAAWSIAGSPGTAAAISPLTLATACLHGFAAVSTPDRRRVARRPRVPLCSLLMARRHGPAAVGQLDIDRHGGVAARVENFQGVNATRCVATTGHYLLLSKLRP